MRSSRIRSRRMVASIVAAGATLATGAARAESAALAPGETELAQWGARASAEADEAEAEAEERLSRRTRGWVPDFMTARAGVELDAAVRPEAESEVIAWTLVAQAADPEFPLGLYLEVPFAYWSTPLPTTEYDTAVAGNPTIGLRAGGRVSEDVAVYGGFAGSIPTLPEDAEPHVREAAEQATIARLGADVHRFAPGFVPLRPFVGLEARFVEHLHLRIGASPLLLVPLGYGRGGGTSGPTFALAGSEELVAIVEQTNEVEVRSVQGFGAGARLQASVVLADVVLPVVGAEPFLSYEPPVQGPHKVPFFARAGVMMLVHEVVPGEFPFTPRLSVGTKLL